MINKKESGQILVMVFVALGVVLFTVLFLIGGAQIFFGNATYSVNSEKAAALAEAGIDKALNSLNKTGGSYNGETETILGDGSYSVTVTNKDAATKILNATGYIPNKTNYKIKKNITVQVSNGTGISFIYGMLVGNGGISMGNGSQINGSVYSNGNISGGNNEVISGDAYVAGGTQPNADQESDCSGVNCDLNGFIFGKTVAGSDQLSVAQSFRPSVTSVINKVSLKLRKVGFPANPTVRIMADNNGSPDKNNILTSGTLSAYSVTEQFGFADVAFTSTPTLTADTSYWIMISAQKLDNSNYWAWSEDLARIYNRGISKWSSDWSKGNWTTIESELGFKTWMGGLPTSLIMSNGSVIGGNVHANTINGVTINKDAYYQVISNSTVKGSSHPGSADPPAQAMPIFESNITTWKENAQNLITGTDITGCPSNVLGPGKIDANVTTDSHCTITIKTPLYITKNLTFGNSTIFKMDSSMGSSSGMIIVDGVTVFQNSDNLLGTGSPGSYLMLLSTYNSQTTPAINTGNSSITGILYAPYGIISLSNNANFKEAVAWQINMGTGTILSYDQGLASTFFSSGPSGSFSLIKGTYQVK